METIELFAQRIGRETGLGKPPIMIDGQTRLQLMNLDHNAFCFHNLGFGNEQWLVWRNPEVVTMEMPKFKQLLPVAKPECDECYDQEGSYGCIRPSHEAFKRKFNKAVNLDPMVPLAEKDKSMFDGLWWSRKIDLFFEVEGIMAYLLDEEGFRIEKDTINMAGYLTLHTEYLDERHCSTRTHPQGSTRPWPELKGRSRGPEDRNIPLGKL